MKKLMVFVLFALSLGLTACGGNSNPLGSDDPFENQPEEVKNGMLKPGPKPPDEKPLGKDFFVIDGEGFAEHIILQQNSNREVILTARSFFDKAQFKMEITNLKTFEGAKVTSTDGDASTKTPATIKFKWTPTADDVVDQVTVYKMDLIVYTTNLKNAYSYQKSLSVFVYREDYSAPEVLNIQKITTPFKEGTSKNFIVTVRDKDGLASPFEARPSLMFLPKYTYYSSGSVVPYMSAGSPSQDPKDPTLWNFTVTVDLSKAEITENSATATFMVAARSRFDKVSVPQPGEFRVLTSLSQMMSTAGSDIVFKKGANNHYEFQVFDPKSEGAVTMIAPPNCALMPGATCGCTPKATDPAIVSCYIDWNVPVSTLAGTSTTLTYSAQNANTDKSDTQYTTTTFNLKIVVAE